MDVYLQLHVFGTKKLLSGKIDNHSSPCFNRWQTVLSINCSSSLPESRAWNFPQLLVVAHRGDLGHVHAPRSQLSLCSYEAAVCEKGKKGVTDGTQWLLEGPRPFLGFADPFRCQPEIPVELGVFELQEGQDSWTRYTTRHQRASENITFIPLIEVFPWGCARSSSCHCLSHASVSMTEQKSTSASGPCKY